MTYSHPFFTPEYTTDEICEAIEVKKRTFIDWRYKLLTEEHRQIDQEAERFSKKNGKQLLYAFSDAIYFGIIAELMKHKIDFDLASDASMMFCNMPIEMIMQPSVEAIKKTLPAEQANKKIEELRLKTIQQEKKWNEELFPDLNPRPRDPSCLYDDGETILILGLDKNTVNLINLYPIVNEFNESQAQQAQEEAVSIIQDTFFSNTNIHLLNMSDLFQKVSSRLREIVQKNNRTIPF